MKIKNYVKPTSLEEAYQWNQKRSARLMGGMLWLRLGRGTIQTAIDLSGLGLEGIRETEDPAWDWKESGRQRRTFT